MKKIILFDGVCNFCNGAVQFIIKRDKTGQFQFASLQGEVGQKIIKKYKIPYHIDSLVLIEENKYYVKSTAALKICKQLSGLWPLFYLFIVLPSFIRDKGYDLIARNRYRFFGKQESCMLPSKDIRERFLD